MVVLACFLWYWSVKAGDSTFLLLSEDGRPAGLGWVLLITAERTGVPAPHMVPTDPVGGGTLLAVGMKVLAAFLGFSDTCPARSASLPASRGWKSRLPMRTLLAWVAAGHSLSCGALAIVEQFRVGEFSVLLGCLLYGFARGNRVLLGPYLSTYVGISWLLVFSSPSQDRWGKTKTQER